MFDAFGTLIAFDLLGLAPDSPAGLAVHFFVMDVAKILVLLTTVIYLMGWLRALLTPERVRAMMKGRSGPGARLTAVGLGAVTPFCSCSSIPLFIGFVEAGIPLGVTLSFLIASPMVNQVAVVVLAGVIGWQMTLIYVFTGLSIAFVGGYILQAFRLERWVEDYVWQIRMGETQAEARVTSLRARHDYAWNEVRQIVGRIWKYVLIGVGIGALIHGYVPQDFVARIAGDGSVLSVIVAVLVGIPMYSDAVGIIPVAEALLGKGVPLGTVLAFMMAVTALSLPSLIMLKRVVKLPLLATFTGVVAAVSIGSVLGVAAAYFGGLFDDVMMRICELKLALPGILFVALFVTGFGESMPTLIVLIGLVYFPGVVRIVRAQALTQVNLGYVKAAQLRGESALAVILREIYPNTLDVVYVEFAIRMSHAILLLSTLSFLGLGISPPTPDWGLMVSEGVAQIAYAPWLVLAPAIFISTLVLGLNFGAEALASALGMDATRGQVEGS